jgi:hypothetical protein
VGDALRLLELLKKLAVSDCAWPAPEVRDKERLSSEAAPLSLGSEVSGCTATAVPPVCTCFHRLVMQAPQKSSSAEQQGGPKLTERLLELIWRLTIPAGAYPELVLSNALADVLQRYTCSSTTDPTPGSTAPPLGLHRGGSGDATAAVGISGTGSTSTAAAKQYMGKLGLQYCEQYLIRCVKLLQARSSVFNAQRVLRSLLELFQQIDEQHKLGGPSSIIGGGDAPMASGPGMTASKVREQWVGGLSS